MIVLDAGLRANKVHDDYLAGRNWQKRAAVEATGFGFGTVGGLAVGAAAVKGGTALGIAMLATPVGWVIIIGAAVTVGVLAAKVGDGLGQGAAGCLYEKSSTVNWF
ncbi:hypothetical protein [Colwellia sp. KU-HH00111]|uniref:hypothetical protein n=1 Tax=Colwellia sp. KU-HH00111 TaxID=3127652 RepID=UPI0033659D60